MSCCCCTWWIATAFIAWYFIRRLLGSKVKVGNLEKKTVLITGCDTGFGKMTAEKLGQSGVKVLAGCLTQQGIDYFKNKKNVTGFQMDVTKQESIDATAKMVKEQCPEGLWALINNAGLLRGGLVEVMSRRDWELQWEVNVLGVAMTTKALIPALRKAKGRIINIASVAGRFSTPGVAAYNATKYAVEGLSDALRREVGIWGISTVIIEPGIMKTNLWDAPFDQKKFQAEIDALPTEQRDLYGLEYFRKSHEEGKKLVNDVGGDPNQVVDALEQACVSFWPRTRYCVGKDGPVWLLLSYLPTIVTDALLAYNAKSNVPAGLQKKKQS